MVIVQEVRPAADDLEQFEQQVDRMLRDSRGPHRHPPRTRLWHPPTDVYEREDAIVIKIEIAGMDPQDFAISFVGRTLTVQGRRKDMDAKSSYHRLEILYGEFRTDVLLRGAYETNEIEAKYLDGFLYIILPKSRQEFHVPIRAK